ncbi:MAG: thiamine-phosphate kinase [Candidatus Omnitrophica bacterium]|nr:thiamine-phosphate kinase [Candidatus Omnitrophota bacterium]
MLISKIGEFGLIERIKKLVKTGPLVIKGIGDDCAVLRFDRNKYLLSTCDMIVEGVDFTRKDSPYLIGRKSLAVSISDIAACAGTPRYALFSMGIPRNSTVEFIGKIIKGIVDLAKAYKIDIVGGDLSRSEKLIIDVNVLGFVEKINLVLRNGAKVGDIIFASGTLGGSILGRHLKFSPRIKEARYLVNNFKINAMIDVSDGLAQDLSHILKESEVGALIYEVLIPQSNQASDLEDALYSGEDFELLFTMSRKEARKLFSRRSKIFTPIGEIVERKYGFRLMDERNRERVIKPEGFRHF